MDRELRRLERLAAREASYIPQLALVAARSGQLHTYPHLVPEYFKALETLGELKDLILNYSPDFLPDQWKIVAYHLTHGGSGDFSTFGHNSIDNALRAVQILFEEELFSRCLLVCVPFQRESTLNLIEEKYSECAAGITLTTYTRIWREPFYSHALENPYPIIIAREAHRLKNPETKQARATHTLGDQAIYRLALTSTPLTRNLADLYGLMRFIEPEAFGTSKKTFMQKYMQQQTGPFSRRWYTGPKPGAGEDILRKIKQHSIRYTDPLEDMS